MAWLSACQSTSVTLDSDLKEATLNEVAANDANAAGRSLGKLPINLQGSQTQGTLYSLEAPGHEKMMVIFPGDQQGTVLKLKLKPVDNEDKKKLIEAQTANEVLRRQLEEQSKTLEESYRRLNGSLRDLVQTQRYLSLRAFADAEAVLNRVHSGPENQRPAQAYVLRGKVRMAQGKRAEARSDFEKALQIFPDDPEVKALLEQTK